MAYHQEHKQQQMLARMQEKGTSYTVGGSVR
jgi:hypothetical protein